MTKFIVETKFARRLPDPTLGKDAERFIFLAPVERVPAGIPRDPNPRSPNIDRGVWKEIARHLLNEDGTPNTFHLKNKGITLIASSVEKLDDDSYSLVFEDGDGVVDGGHTYELLTERADEIRRRQSLGDDLHQFVKIEVLTGVSTALANEIAGGLNTALAVKAYSLENLKGRFEWIKEEIAGRPYRDDIAFRENDPGEIDIRDLLVVLDLFNVEEFPNDGTSYPTRAYGSKQAVLDNYVDNQEHYERLRPILNDVLYLHDLIHLQAWEMHNAAGGKAGNLSFIDGDGDNKERFRFPFARKSGPYRLQRAAHLPMLGAFRWLVRLDQATGLAQWDGGFETVLKVWGEVGIDLMRATQRTSQENNRKVHAIGRSTNHWESQHNIVAKRHLMMTRK